MGTVVANWWQNESWQPGESDTRDGDRILTRAEMVCHQCFERGW